MRFCTCLLYHTRRKPPFPCLGHAGQDRKSAGDVMGHKCAGLFDIAYWCVLCLCGQMQHTIEISTNIMRAHNMPCHHTSMRPPIHHQKYPSNATATPEKYLANIAKHSIKTPATQPKHVAFLCVYCICCKRLAWTRNSTTPKQDKGQHVAQNGSTWAQY